MIFTIPCVTTQSTDPVPFLIICYIVNFPDSIRPWRMCELFGMECGWLNLNQIKCIYRDNTTYQKITLPYRWSYSWVLKVVVRKLRSLKVPGADQKTTQPQKRKEKQIYHNPFSEIFLRIKCRSCTT